MLHTKEKTTRFSFYFPFIFIWRQHIFIESLTQYITPSYSYFYGLSINVFYFIDQLTCFLRLKGKPLEMLVRKIWRLPSFLKTILILSCFYFPFSNKQKAEWHPVELHVFSNSVIHKLCEKSFTGRENFWKLFWKLFVSVT